MNGYRESHLTMDNEGSNLQQGKGNGWDDTAVQVFAVSGQ